MEYYKIITKDNSYQFVRVEDNNITKVRDLTESQARQMAWANPSLDPSFIFSFNKPKNKKISRLGAS